MELSVQTFLDSVTNPNTKKEYRHGVKKFCEWFGKSAEEVLAQRQDDLTQKSGENLIEFKNRASRFEREIENFHAWNLKQGCTLNTARNQTIGIRQLFRFYQMSVVLRTGSAATKTVKTNKNFPLSIEHVRKLYAVGDLRERVILSVATDLGLRIGDFLKLKLADLPDLAQEPPVSFDVMTDKEDVIAHGFLSAETIELLKTYIPTLSKRNHAENVFLFPSNGTRAISDEWLNRLLQNLAMKAGLNLGGKEFTFHTFRKMFLSAAIDSGIGLTAGKKLCGKAVPQSDDTYLTTVHLREKFIQLKKFLAINEKPREEAERIDTLKSAITNLQGQLTEQRLVTDTVSEENVSMKKRMQKLEEALAELRKMLEDLQSA